MQHELEVPYRIEGASPCMQEAWGIVCQDVYDANATTPFFMFPYYVFALRTALNRQPLSREDGLVEHGRIVRENRRILEAMNAESSKSSARTSSEKQRLREDVKYERQKMTRERRSVSSKEKLVEMNEEYRKGQERLKAFAEADEVEWTGRLQVDSTSGVSDLPSARDKLLQQSPFATMRIGGSCSSKLNFILNEVCLILCPNDWFLTYASGTYLRCSRENPHILERVI